MSRYASKDADVAQTIHRKMGFKQYSGKKLDGPRHVIAYGSKRYPESLMRVSSPPDCLYVIGDPDSLQEGLAVIGARKATPYGISCASLFSRLAAEQGIVIISGGARGCDSAAHQAALDCGGRTVAFLGGGCDQIYPACNFSLFQRIIEQDGAVISEHSWEFPALPYAFRARNRLIAGLSKATLIVEAGMPSGTFSTADEALSLGRDVFAVPGAITSKHSLGSNMLIQQGATPIVDESSFYDSLFNVFSLLRLESIAGQRKGSSKMHMTNSYDATLLDALRAQPMRIDEIAEWMSMRGCPDEYRTRIHMTIAAFERDSLIARYPDGRYGPVARFA